MKVFDTDEQDIIRKITQGSGYSRNLIYILDSRNNFHNTRIQIDKTSKSAIFLFQILSTEPTEAEIQWAIERQKKLIELLIKHLTLLRYLEKEELAVFFEPAKNTEPTIAFGMGAVNMPSFSVAIDDQNVVDLLIKYLHKEIMPSPSLRILENNKFVSDEEIRFRKQQLATWIAIIASILFGLCGMYNNNQNSITQEKQFKKYIAENQKSVEAISVRLEQLSKSRVDYNLATRELSEEISKLLDKFDFVPKYQTIKVKLSKDTKDN